MEKKEGAVGQREVCGRGGATPLETPS